MADTKVHKKRIEHWPIEKLIPSAHNARNHPDEQARQIASAIAEFGWTIPVLIDEAGEIIAGHGRVLAA
jgi:ParB-like chromosome segregation protein Spo0J